MSLTAICFDWELGFGTLSTLYSNLCVEFLTQNVLFSAWDLIKNLFETTEENERKYLEITSHCNTSLKSYH